jgi:hypothetical protein
MLRLLPDWTGLSTGLLPRTQTGDAPHSTPYSTHTYEALIGDSH